jgi:non-homologous end joining protein Ku
MNDQHLNKTGKSRPSLDRRLADNPELAEAFHALIDEMDQSLSQSASADDVEERVQAGVRKVGHEALSHWAQQAEANASRNAPQQKPGAVKHAKKNSSGKRSSATSKSRSKSGG